MASFGSLSIGNTLVNWNEFIKGPPRQLRLEHMPCDERLRYWVWYSLEKRWLQEDLITAPDCLHGSYQREGASLLTAVHGGRVRDNRQKLKQETVRLDVGRNFPAPSGWSNGG